MTKFDNSGRTKVVFYKENGTVELSIQEGNQTDTYVAAMEHMGIEKIAKLDFADLGIEMPNRLPVVYGGEIDKKYTWRTYKDLGLRLQTSVRFPTQRQLIRDIAKELGLLVIVTPDDNDKNATAGKDFSLNVILDGQDVPGDDGYVEVYLETLRRVGPERLAESDIKIHDELIVKRTTPEHLSRPLCEGYFAVTQRLSGQIERVLNEIKNKFDLDMDFVFTANK